MIETGWVLLDGQIITVVGSGIPPKVKNQADFVRIDCASLNLARAIGIDLRKGTLEPGKDADLFLFDPNFQINRTLAEGQIVYTI